MSDELKMLAVSSDKLYRMHKKLSPHLQSFIHTLSELVEEDELDGTAEAMIMMFFVMAFNVDRFFAGDPITTKHPHWREFVRDMDTYAKVGTRLAMLGNGYAVGEDPDVEEVMSTLDSPYVTSNAEDADNPSSEANQLASMLKKLEPNKDPTTEIGKIISKTKSAAEAKEALAQAVAKLKKKLEEQKNGENVVEFPSTPTKH